MKWKEGKQTEKSWENRKQVFLNSSNWCTDLIHLLIKKNFHSFSSLLWYQLRFLRKNLDPFSFYISWFNTFFSSLTTMENSSTVEFCGRQMNVCYITHTHTHTYLQNFPNHFPPTRKNLPWELNFFYFVLCAISTQRGMCGLERKIKKEVEEEKEEKLDEKYMFFLYIS